MSSHVEQSDIEISDDGHGFLTMHSDDSLASNSSPIEISIEDSAVPPSLRALTEEHRYLAYSEDDKGALHDVSNEPFPCTERHLETIKHNLLALERQYLYGRDFLGTEIVMNQTKDQITRLLNYPQLFRSRDVEVRFWNDTYSICDRLIETTMPAVMSHAKDHQKIINSTFKEFRRMVFPTFDRQRKPWEQFLHNRGPGAGANISVIDHEGSVQLLPMSAVRIIVAMNNEHRSIIRDIEAQRTDFTLYQEIATGPTYGAPKISADGHLRTQKAMTHLILPSIAATAEGPRHEGMQSLEELNQDYGTGLFLASLYRKLILDTQLGLMDEARLQGLECGMRFALWSKTVQSLVDSR